MRRWTPLLRVTRTGIVVRPVMTGNRTRANHLSSTGAAVRLCFHSTNEGVGTLTLRRRWPPATATIAKTVDHRRSFSTDMRHFRVVTAAYGCALQGRTQEGKKIGHDSYFIAETEKFTALGCPISQIDTCIRTCYSEFCCCCCCCFFRRCRWCYSVGGPWG